MSTEQDMPEGEEPPPPGARTMALVRWALLGSMAVLAVFAWASFARSDSSKDGAASHEHKVRYRCPMHPQVVSDQPGECPICHMTLQPFDVEEPDAGTASPPPQHVHVHAARDVATDAGPVGTVPAGTTPIQLSFDRVQAIGVRTAVATSREMKHATRVTAVVEPAEQGASEVHVRTAGFVENILVNQTGGSVAPGQPLFLFYSPAIFEAEQELVAMGRWVDAGDPTTSAVRTKLSLLGMQDGEIDDVGRAGKAKRAVVVVAPKAGWVVKKSVTLGSYVTPEMVLYSIQDLSRVYVVASVFQPDRRAIAVGTTGTFRPDRKTDKAMTARVDLVYPSVSADARTTRVRMQVDNPSRELLPGDYGTVEFAAEQRTTTTIPRDAVISTGTQTYVFIDDGGGRFTPRTVVVGAEDGEEMAIEAGVEPGERVVSGATFLIDSESRLQASVSTQTQASPCDTDFDKAKFPDKWSECRKCEQTHAGMGSMVTDCKNAIPKPWK